MPICEYICKSCKNELERQWSLPAVKSEATAQLSKKAAQKRDKAEATDRMHEQLKYEKSHDRHG